MTAGSDIPFAEVVRMFESQRPRPVDGTLLPFRLTSLGRPGIAVSRYDYRKVSDFMAGADVWTADGLAGDVSVFAGVDDERDVFVYAEFVAGPGGDRREAHQVVPLPWWAATKERRDELGDRWEQAARRMMIDATVGAAFELLADPPEVGTGITVTRGFTWPARH